MKYILFNNKKVDTGLFIQLQDMSCVLSGVSDLKFKFDFGHYIDVKDKVIAVSHFWDNLPQTEMEAGYKTDIFLRTIGTLQFTELAVIQDYMQVLEQTNLRKFGIQLFTLLEDLRIEEQCIAQRPGTARLFEIRKNEYRKYFESQLKVNAGRGFAIDELFCMLYLTLYANSPEVFFSDANRDQMLQLNELKYLLYDAFATKTTRDVFHLACQIVWKLTASYEKDSLNEYFILPVYYSNLQEQGLTFDQLKRRNQLANRDFDDQVHKSEEAAKEKLPTWHRETKDSKQSRSYLQFDMESGTQTSMLGGAAREEQEPAQAMGTVLGKTQQNRNNDFSSVEDDVVNNDEPKNGGAHPYGEANKDAVLLIKPASTPSMDDLDQYETLLSDVEVHIQRLSRTIDKILEHKQTDPRKNLLFGRLSKKLLPIVLDDFPRVFYKKNNRSREINAVFTLLVDCSASMHDKMMETKKGIILFHEVLKELQIAHSIIGFWEDANQVREGYQPNFFHVITDFQQSIYSKTGAEIMQLEPQEDNRDGFSIRAATQELQKRNEKNKFLLIFSDGEPAAANYDQNGIVDTREAVTEARKKGVEVIGMYLSSQQIIAEEEQATMQNIYGKENIMIPGVEHLPDDFVPLLKRLLLKSL